MITRLILGEEDGVGRQVRNIRFTPQKKIDK